MIDNLRYGADTLVDESVLRPMTDENSKSMFLPHVGKHYTDQLATMIKKKFVCGPFDTSPIPNLRINSLFAVQQSDKYRPILNLSKPDGNNFNDAVIPSKMRKVSMSTSRQFAETLHKTGKGSIISKLDHVSAYKLIPVKPEQYYLQGFTWLGKIFIEVRLIFGASSSVPNYDDFHQTVSDLVRVKSNTDPQFLHRTLDDQVIVTPNFEENRIFVETYLDLADKINLPLADMSGSDKAFMYQTSGTVLGVNFDTTSMSWKYNEDKRIKHMKIFNQAISSPKVTATQLFQVCGVLNTLVLMCPLLRFFRDPILLLLTDIEKVSPIRMSSAAANLLHFWLHVFDELKYGFPIPNPIKNPPAIVLTFVSNAAGCPDPALPLA